MKRSYRESVLVDAVFKIIVIGNTDVGKSSIIQRIVDNNFHQAKSPTYGVDRNDIIVDCKDGLKIKFSLWDTAGQQTYKNVTSNFIKGCAGIMLCFDLTNLNSFLGLGDWMKIVHELTCDSQTTIHLIGNKCDLSKESWKIDPTEVQKFLAVHRVQSYHEVPRCYVGICEERYRGEGRVRADGRFSSLEKHSEAQRRVHQQARKRPQRPSTHRFESNR